MQHGTHAYVVVMYAVFAIHIVSFCVSCLYSIEAIIDK